MPVLQCIFPFFARYVTLEQYKGGISVSMHIVRKKTISLKTSTYMATLAFVGLFTVLICISFYIVGSVQITRTLEANTERHIQNVDRLVEHNFAALLSQLNVVINSSEFNQFKYTVNEEKFVGRLGNHIKLSNKLSNFYEQNIDKLESVFLYLDDNSIMQYFGNNFLKSINLSFEELHQKYGSGQLVYARHNRLIPFETAYERENSIGLLYLMGSSQTPLRGVLSVNIRSSFLADLIETQITKPGSSISLMEGMQYAIAQPADGRLTLTAAQMQTLAAQIDAQLTQNVVRLEVDGFVAFYSPLSVHPLGIVIAIPRSEFYMELDYFTAIIPWALLLMFLMGITLSVLLTRWLNKPIKRITEKMALVGQGQLDTVFDVQGVSEINTINDTARLLTGNISQLLQNVFNEQKSKRRAELAALQAQINPHFLYNALYATRQLCEMTDTPAAIEMIDDLSVFYRIGTSKGKSRIPLSQELAHVHSYLKILKRRFEDSFDYDIEIPEECMECTILKLTLQPLVENAIYHGLQPRGTKGRLLIAAEMLKHSLYVHIIDDGIGMSEKTLTRLEAELNDLSIPEDAHSSTTISDMPLSYGVKNVHQRLKLAFGERYGLSLHSSLNCGTTVSVCIPLSPEEV